MLPRYIALCGRPKSGKSKVQEYLNEIFGVQPIDDGKVLREACKILYGLNDNDVYTQEGKHGFVDICGKSFQVRDLLGELGNMMEDTYGEFFMPEAAVREANKYGYPTFSFGSVRKTQGHFYKQQGGIVIEVIRPGVPESPYDFDKYDQNIIDHQIHNDGSLEDLRNNVAVLFHNIQKHFPLKVA